MKIRFIKYHLLNIIVTGISLTSFGQIMPINNETLQTPKEYYLQVKQFGEFIDRFNYKTDWIGKLITDEFAKKVPRSNYLLYLINAEDTRLINDSLYRELCSQFIAYIDNQDNPQYINLYSGNVKANAKVNITYNGKENWANIELIPEVLPDRSAKWVINKVNTNCFKAIEDSLAINFISPNSHETNFINLRKLNGYTNPIYYFPTSVGTNHTMLFLTEIAKNRIKIQTIEKVTYTITLTDWEITVEEFNRSSNNSGWLISNIKKR
ncbi:MAG: hypothetical protein AB7S48_04925 [Bacteroidales bacterium]